MQNSLGSGSNKLKILKDRDIKRNHVISEKAQGGGQIKVMAA